MYPYVAIDAEQLGNLENAGYGIRPMSPTTIWDWRWLRTLAESHIRLEMREHTPCPDTDIFGEDTSTW